MTADPTLTNFLNNSKALVDEALEHYLPSPPACPEILSEAMRYSVFAGGKRLRPILTLAAADAVSRLEPLSRHPNRRAIDLTLPAACAMELIHTYSLIHDDLPAMDNDTLRRGRPTLHVVYGEGVAILAGDALLTEAFVLLTRYPEVDESSFTARKLWAVSVVANAAGAGGMVAGQALDLQASGQAPGRPLTLDIDGVRAMHQRKTGALIHASAMVGAIIAGASHGAIAAISRYATEIGLAFQIVDDILDVEGNAAELGKTAGKDAARAKPTYPALYGLARSRQLAAECAARAHQTLVDARLSEGYLGAIVDWIVTRTN